MREYEIERNPVERVSIDGREYDVELGNLTFALDAAEWAESLRSLAGAESMEEGDLASRFEALCSAGRSMVASLVGDEAAEELVGGRNRLNIYRLMGVVGALADVVSGEASMRAMAEAASRRG